MKPVKIIFALMLMVLAFNSHAQFGEIRGIVTDVDSKEPLPFATVTYNQNGTIKGVTTDEKGQYKIKPLTAGKYDLSFSYLGYTPYQLKEVSVSAEKVTYADVTMKASGFILPGPTITWEPPMIDPGITAVMDVISAEEIDQAIERDVVSLVANTAGVYQREEGGSINVRGTRENATLYVVDGIKMIGGFTIPKGAIQEISVLSGGIPAQFGDATGGVVIITTKSYRMK
ncbi:MAG: carboxypeptidase regulatory-like domain-containing protein [Bacteroidetes bacterium]|nr:carboxypeptidase regulatory-like domain-containing protein [Bacteroidota bacterium]